MSRIFYTADEVGTIKVVTIFDPPAPAKPQRRGKRAAEEGSKAEPIVIAQPTIATWGTVDRALGVVLMNWDHGKHHLVVARKNGAIQLLNPLDGTIVHEVFEKLEKVGKVETTFVGVFANAKSIISCTNTGVLSIRSVQEPTTPPAIYNVGQDICRMKVHPKEHHLVGTAGKEQEFTIWDLNQLAVTASASSKSGSSKPLTKKEKAAAAKAEAAAAASAPAPVSGLKTNVSPHKSKDILGTGQTFKAKNVKNDTLDLRVPVWNTDFEFLDKLHVDRIAVGTRHHQIRVYDINKARRPVVDAEIGEMPVITMCAGRDGSEILFSDTHTNVFGVDTLTGKIVGQYKGFAGVATALECFWPLETSIENPQLVSVAMDRCLRIHEMTKTRKLLHKLYLKQRLTAVVVGPYTPLASKEDDEDNEEDRGDGFKENGERKTAEEEDDDVWDQMGKLEDKKIKKRKITA